MTFGITPEGFKSKKFSDIVQEIGDSLRNDLGIDIDSDPDSVAKIITNIYALSLAEEWALPQALQSMFDIDKAEGVFLDNLVALAGITRTPALSSNGSQYTTADRELILSVGSIFTDTSGNEYNLINATNLVPSSCVEVEFSLSPDALAGETLSITANGVTSSTVLGSNADAAMEALAADINGKTTTNLVTATNTTVGLDGSILVTNVDDTTLSNIINSGNLLVKEITSFSKLQRTETGAIEVLANTVVNPPSNSSIISTTNRYDFVKGSTRETDIELRARYKRFFLASGSATVEAIRTALISLDGVTEVFVEENDTEAFSTTGLPPKSYKAVVTGGDENDIANSLWQNKPAGIRGVGDVVVNVTDSQGDLQSIYFSRPTGITVLVDVSYSLYDEQENLFPIDGEQQIKNQVVAYLSSLPLGEDVIPQRISTHIFNTVQGLSVVNVLIGLNEPLSTDIIPVSKTEFVNSNTDDVEVRRI